MSIARITADLDLNSAKYRQEYDRAILYTKKKSRDFRRYNKRAGDSLGKAMKAGMVATTAAFAAASLGVKKTASEIDALAKKSDRLGVPIDQLIGLEHAADLSGVAIGTLEKALINQNKAAKQAMDGSAAYSRIFSELNIDLQKFMAMSPDEQLYLLADSLQGVESEQRKLAIATELYGSRGTAMLNMLKGGSEALRAQKEDAQKLGLTLSRLDASKVEAMNDAMNRASKATKGFFNRLTVEVAPAMTALSNMFVNNAKASGGFTDTASKGAGIVTKAINVIGDALEVVQRGWLLLRKIVARSIVTVLSGIESMIGGINKASKLIGADIGKDALASITNIKRVYVSGVDDIEARIEEFDKKRIFEGTFSERFAREMQAVKDSIKDAENAAKKSSINPEVAGASSNIIDLDAARQQIQSLRDGLIDGEEAIRLSHQRRTEEFNKQYAKQIKLQEQHRQASKSVMDAEIVDFRAAQMEKQRIALQDLSRGTADRLSETNRYRNETENLRIAALERSGMFAQAEVARYEQEKAMRVQQKSEALFAALGDEEAMQSVRNYYRELEEAESQKHQKRLTEIEESEQAKRDELRNRQLSVMGTFYGNLATLAGRHSRKGKALAFAQATVSAIQTGISTRKNAAEAGLMEPIPAGLGVAAFAAQMAQARRIQKQSYAGAFQNGGIVGGNSYTGDKLTANVNSGEMWLNAQQQKRLFNIADGKATAGGGISKIEIVNNGSPMQIENAQQDGDKLTVFINAAKKAVKAEFAQDMATNTGYAALGAQRFRSTA